ncbi:MAG: chorismate mutase [Bauldia sp.]|nr:chorismate mutase [Bauldia sp.]
MPAPADCTTKAEIRAEIDRLDRALVALLGERFAYVRRMAAVKQDPGEALDPDRVEDVLARVVAEARAQGLDPDLIEAMWRQLIEWNVAFEARTIAGKG